MQALYGGTSSGFKANNADPLEPYWTYYEPIMSTKPSPTEKDYIKGYFNRYIVKRRNSYNHYYEVDKKTHKSINNKEGKYDDYLHTSKKIKWNLSDNSGKINNLEIRKYLKKILK